MIAIRSFCSWATAPCLLLCLHAYQCVLASWNACTNGNMNEMCCYAKTFAIKLNVMQCQCIHTVSLARNLSHMYMYYIHIHITYMYVIKVNANTGVYYPVLHSLCHTGLCVWSHWFTCCYVCGQNTDCWGLYQKISPAKYNLTLTLKWNFSKYGNLIRHEAFYKRERRKPSENFITVAGVHENGLSVVLSHEEH